MWKGTEERVVREGTLKCMRDKRKRESILEERRLERNDRLDTCQRSANEEILRAFSM